MKPIVLSIVINRTPGTVFDAFTDIERWPERMTAIKRVERLTDGPVGTGTRFRETRVMFGREATETMAVTRFEPPRLFTLETLSGGARYLATHEFVAEGAGATRVTLRFEATPLTFAARVMGILMRPLIRKMCSAMNDDLVQMKASIEADPPSQAAA